jgi:hypothetical protein
MRKKLPQISDGNINFLTCITVWKILALPTSDLLCNVFKGFEEKKKFFGSLFVNFKAKQA